MLQANVFFFITSIAVVVFTVFLCVALYYIIKILKSLRNITERVEHGSEVLAEDIEHVRKFFTEGSLISHIIGMFMGMSKQDRTRKKRSKRGTKVNIKDEE